MSGSATGGSPRWFDSHCHLQERYLKEGGAGPEGDEAGSERAALLGARSAGVERLVCVGTDPESSKQAVELAEAVARGELGEGLAEVWATVGLHPHDAATGGLSDLRQLLSRSAATGSVVAVGECGLDFHYDHSPRPVQRAVFAEQIALAKEFGLPLVIHAREAWEDLFDVLGAEGVPERAVLHCFTGGPREATSALDLGLWLSFSGIVTFKRADDVRQAAVLCPPERLLVETDSPFLAPVPHRGRPNTPAFVPLVGQAVAEIKGLGLEEVAESSWESASVFFGV